MLYCHIAIKYYRLYGNKLKSVMFKELAPAISKLKMIHTLM